MTCVYKEYEVKIKMAQLLCSGGGGGGGSGGGGGRGGGKLW